MDPQKRFEYPEDFRRQEIPLETMQSLKQFSVRRIPQEEDTYELREGEERAGTFKEFMEEF